MSPVVKPVAFFRGAFIELLLDLDFREPAQQAFPDQAGSVIPGRTASEIWLCDETSGNLIGEVASTALVPTTSPHQGRTSVGFYDGTNTYNKKCVAFDDATNQKFLAASATPFDAPTTSIAVLLVFRLHPSSTTLYLFGKRQTTPPHGYWITTQTGGRITWGWSGEDSGTVSGAVQDAAYDYQDDAWHAALTMIDRNTGDVKLFTDQGSDSGTIAGTIDLTSTVGFSLGASRTQGAKVDIAYCAIFEGADAEGLGQSDLDAFWTHATQNTTPELDTYTRASLACPIVGDDSSYGDRVGKYGPGQFASGYNSVHTHASKLGIFVEDAATNLCKGSEEAATGTDYVDIGTPTSVANANEAPDGTQTMNTIAAAGGVEGRKQTITVLAETDYAWSLFAGRGDTGVNAFGDVEIFDVTNTAVIGSAALALDFNVDDKVRRNETTFTTPAGCVSIEFRLKVDDGSKIAEWGWQLEINVGGNLNEGATTYIPTPTGASATRIKTDVVLLNAGGNTYHNPVAGEVESISAASLDNDASDGYVWMIGNPLNDRLVLKYQGTSGVNDRPNFVHWDSSAVIKVTKTVTSPATSHHLGHTVRYRWDSVDELDEHAGENWDIHVNGVRTAGAAVTWTAGNNADKIRLGFVTGGAQYLNGTIARIRIWNKPRKDVP